jgi:hypothetical protein
MTGLNPMKTIAVATKAFDLLEAEVLKRSKRKHISCGWVDNRRRDVYYKFLSKRGYQYGRLGDYKCLYKVVE